MIFVHNFAKLQMNTNCEISRVRAMLLMGVAYIFLFTILLLVDLPLNSTNQHQVSIMKCV